MSADGSPRTARLRDSAWLPFADLVAPPEPSVAVARVRNLAVVGAALPWLLPASPSLGTEPPERIAVASGAFVAAAVVCHFLRRRGSGLAASVVVAVAGLAAGPVTWTVGLAAIAAAGPVVSRWRRARLPWDRGNPPAPVLAGIAWTIVGVLLFREFAGLPIRVPTGSMQPTIYGNRPGASGDHLLVDRTPYVVRDPQRWEIAVFDFPLHRPTSFVKRVIGLPGETVEIVDGDLWIDGRIARKPALLQETLWRELFPQPNPVAQVRKVARDWTAADRRGGGGWAADGDGVRCATAPGRASALKYSQRLPQGDLRLRATVEQAAGCVALLRLRTRGRTLELRWAAEGADGGSSLRVVEDGAGAGAGGGVNGGASVAIDSVAAPGSSHRIELALADGRAVARIDGAERAEALVPTDGPNRHGAEIAAEGPGGGASATFRELRLDQDQRWSPAKDGTRLWEVPAGAYFVLGDHTEQSEDSREWRVTEFALRDGRVLRAASDFPDERGAPTPNLRRDGDDWVFRDVDGVLRRVAREDAEPGRRAVAAPFVPRGHFVGRAILVFWPWTPNEGGFRPRLLP